LIKSRVFVPILSREALNSTSVARQNISLLTESSGCDNVLLEYRLALELRERDLVEKIYPVMIGDLSGDDYYLHYFKSGCHPALLTVKEVVVEALELKLQEHLDRQCLGSPLIDDMSVADIVERITSNQGLVVEGSKEIALNRVKSDMLQMQAERTVAAKRVSLQPLSDRNSLLPRLRARSRAGSVVGNMVPYVVNPMQGTLSHEIEMQMMGAN
jgi:hypothetical protein